MEDINSIGNLDPIKRVFFLGIGGIGMSALARYFKSEGKEIFGYDKTKSKLTKKLVNEGMIIHYKDSVDFIPDNIELVVYTPAVPIKNMLYQWFLNNDYPLHKRSEVLGWISNIKRSIAIAGTHGKTTTASILSYLLKSLGKDPTAFVGGIMKNFDSNFLYGQGDWVIVEADEYDRSFLQLQPEIALITAIDPDHLDIYGDFEDLKKAFKEFTMRIRDHGCLWVHSEVNEMLDSNWRIQLESRGVKILSYGIIEGDVQASSINADDGMLTFSYQDGQSREEQCISTLPGKYNISNMVGAMGVAQEVGLKLKAIKKVLPLFEGIERRFEKIFDDGKLVVISDYAHHPVEIRSAIQAAREMYKSKKLTVIFQPHLFSRTLDFHREFAESFHDVDELILTEIYPAREKPIAGVTSQLILKFVEGVNKRMILKRNLYKEISRDNMELLMILGAGDVDEENERIIKKLKDV